MRTDVYRAALNAYHLLTDTEADPDSTATQRRAKQVSEDLGRALGLLPDANEHQLKTIPRPAVPKAASRRVPAFPCDSSEGGFVCSLGLSHKGPHVAYDYDNGECYAVWTMGRFFNCREE